MLFEDVNRQCIAFVKDSLFKFILFHLPSADLSAIDDVVMFYVYSTLDIASEDFYGQMNDVVSDFSDFLSAYVADFNKVGRNFVCSWMADIITYMEQRSDEARALQQDVKAKEPVGLEISNEKIEKKNKKGTRMSRSNSTSEDEKETVSIFYEDEETYMKCKTLSDMFPTTNPIEIKHCISIGFSDLTVAADALLHRQESGQAYECNSWQVAAKVEAVDDDEMKHRIITRYSYVEKQSQAKEHKPAPPKIEPKKMVRYRDNKIVSLKGERFTEVSKNGEEEGVKKGNKKHHP